MARKKVVLFIVEGITEQESLELLLDECIKDDNRIIFQVVGGDVTSSQDIETSNIKKKITDIIKDGGKRKFKPSDYLEIIHLVDMDAAFISQDSIYLDESLSKFVYKNDGIYAKNIERVVKRNEKKKSLLNLLSSTNKVYGSVLYRVFYFSCNMEHVLHNDIEVEEESKMEYAEEFQDKYIEDLDGFIDLMCKSGFSVNKDYKESWEFIKKNNNSIKRFTNFNILLNDYFDK